jgi:hypothetical protein
MVRDDLKMMWNDAHITNQEITDDKTGIKKSIKMKHSKAVSSVLSDVKMKMLIYSIVLAIYFGLILYAFVYLSLRLSINSVIPLTLAGLFLLVKTTSEVIRLTILTKTADNLTVMGSLLFFRKKLNTIKRIDFLAYLVFLYLLAILTSYNYITDIGGIKNFSWSNGILPVPLLLVFILMLLLMPWFLKYQHNRRYKKLYSDLNDSVRYLNDL